MSSEERPPKEKAKLEMVAPGLYVKRGSYSNRYQLVGGKRSAYTSLLKKLKRSSLKRDGAAQSSFTEHY